MRAAAVRAGGLSTAVDDRPHCKVPSRAATGSWPAPPGNCPGRHANTPTAILRPLPLPARMRVRRPTAMPGTAKYRLAQVLDGSTTVPER